MVPCSSAMAELSTGALLALLALLKSCSVCLSDPEADHRHHVRQRPMCSFLTLSIMLFESHPQSRNGEVQGHGTSAAEYATWGPVVPGGREAPWSSGAPAPASTTSHLRMANWAIRC